MDSIKAITLANVSHILFYYPYFAIQQYIYCYEPVSDF